MTNPDVDGNNEKNAGGREGGGEEELVKDRTRERSREEGSPPGIAVARPIRSTRAKRSSGLSGSLLRSPRPSGA